MPVESIYSSSLNRKSSSPDCAIAVIDCGRDDTLVCAVAHNKMRKIMSLPIRAYGSGFDR